MDKITLTRQQLTDWATSHRGNGKLFTKKGNIYAFRCYEPGLREKVPFPLFGDTFTVTVSGGVYPMSIEWYWNNGKDHCVVDSNTGLWQWYKSLSDILVHVAIKLGAIL